MRERKRCLKYRYTNTTTEGRAGRAHGKIKSDWVMSSVLKSQISQSWRDAFCDQIKFCQRVRAEVLG